MTTTTVGELIELLSNYNKELPVYKSTLEGIGYEPISKDRWNLFRVGYQDHEHPHFAPGIVKDVFGAGGFDAVII